MSLDIDICLPRFDFELTAKMSIDVKGITAISGPSGAGKSSLLRVIAGLEPEARGSISLSGQSWLNHKHSLPTEQRQIGFVFQQPNLFPHLTVAENIEFGQKRAVHNHYELQPLIDIFSLTGFMGRSVQSLSGGEQQRVAIVRALARQPQLLLMDEPFSSFDTALKKGFYRYFDEAMQHCQIAVIMVSHNQQEIARLSDQTIVMERGQIAKSLPTCEFLSQLEAQKEEASQYNLLFGKVVELDPIYQISTLDVEGQSLFISGIDNSIGSRKRIACLASDVSLHLTPDPHTSILNQLNCTVVDWTAMEHGKMLVKLKLQEQPLLCQISARSFDHLGIHKGQQVIAQIKTLVLI